MGWQAMKSELVRIHHASYKEDIPFWISRTEGLDPILEVGCGHGRVTLPLLRAGHEIVGVDRDSEAVAYLAGALRQLTERDRQRSILVNSDIHDYQADRKFGAVIIPCNTYSTFAPGERLLLLEKAFSFLVQGGSMIAGFPNPTRMELIQQDIRGCDPYDSLDLETDFIHPETGFPVQVSSRLRADRQSLFWDWFYDHLFPEGKVERYVVTVEHFPASRDELWAEIIEAGFSELVSLGGYHGELYTESSPYLILISKK